MLGFLESSSYFQPFQGCPHMSFPLGSLLHLVPQRPVYVCRTGKHWDVAMCLLPKLHTSSYQGPFHLPNCLVSLRTYSKQDFLSRILNPRITHSRPWKISWNHMEKFVNYFTHLKKEKRKNKLCDINIEPCFGQWDFLWSQPNACLCLPSTPSLLIS